MGRTKEAQANNNDQQYRCARRHTHQFTMKDKEFLRWLHDRLTQLYGENPNYDYMLKLEAIAKRTPPEQETNIFKEASVADMIERFRKAYSGEGSGMDLLDIIEALNKRMDTIDTRVASAEKRTHLPDF